MNAADVPASPAVGALGGGVEREDTLEPVDRERDGGGVDVVGHIGLVVLDFQAARLQQITGPAPELDADHRVAPPVGNERAHAWAALEVRPPAVDDRHEPRERENPGWGRPVGSEAQRVAHDRAHREAAEHGGGRRDPGPLPQLVVEAGELAVCGMERFGVRMADLRHEIPVMPGPTGYRQRCAGGGDVQAPERVERVTEGEKIVLVGAATVVQHEQAARIRRCRPLAERERAHRAYRRNAVGDGATVPPLGGEVGVVGGSSAWLGRAYRQGAAPAGQSQLRPQSS